SCQLSALRKPGVTFGITAYGITGSIRNLRRVVALAAGTKFGTQAGAIDGKLQKSSSMGRISTTPLMNCHHDPERSRKGRDLQFAAKCRSLASLGMTKV